MTRRKDPVFLFLLPEEILSVHEIRFVEFLCKICLQLSSITGLIGSMVYKLSVVDNFIQ